MTNADYREIVLFGAMVAVVILALLTRLRAHPPIPPVVAPIAQPVEEQVRDVRHRVANVEQQVQLLPDHTMRLRTMEKEVGEVRASLGTLTKGQERIAHQLDLLIAHHLQEPKSP